MRSPEIVTIIGAIALGLTAFSPVKAQVVSFTASDPGATSDSNAPNSKAELNAFNTAAAAIGTIEDSTFSDTSVSTSHYASVTSDQANLTVTDATSDLYVNDAANDAHTYEGGIDGFPTTGSTHFLQDVQANYGGTTTFVFTFTSDIDAFGAYFSGTETGIGSETINFNDGSSQVIAIPESARNVSGLAFAGFTDAGKSIKSVDIENINVSPYRDIFGISGIEASVVTTTPEPTPIAALLVGAMVLGAMVLVRRNKATA